MTLTYGVQIKVSQIAGKLDIGYAISADWNRRKQMNKQEAIEKIYTASWDDFNYKGLIVDVETVNKIIYQIDEPQKVVVPKFEVE